MWLPAPETRPETASAVSGAKRRRAERVFETRSVSETEAQRKPRRRMSPPAPEARNQVGVSALLALALASRMPRWRSRQTTNTPEAITTSDPASTAAVGTSPNTR